MNFSLPNDGVDNRKYIGKGLNWLVKKDKEYTGYNADVAEFNDIFMRGAMGLDCDGTWKSCINLARKNYATLEHEGKIKLTGNTIKSKKLPLYIEDFLDKGVRMLLEGNGKQFVDWYYEYLSVIYNKQIPLMKIAQRAKVKLSISDYVKRSKQTSKSGGAMSMMAHMELIIKNKLTPNLGDVVYYVNNANKASQGDVQKVFTFKMTKKQRELYEINNGKPAPPDKTEIQINCYLLEQKTLENNPEMKGDYNVARAIATFNKRIQPLLVVFKEIVRHSLLVNNPEDMGLFTKEQCELINGHPFKIENQDTIEDLLEITNDEQTFWKNINVSPDYIYDFASEGWQNFV